MAGTKINEYGVGYVSFNSMMETLDRQRRGMINLTLTEMDTTTQPEIAAGSVVDVAGTLYEFDVDTAITGSPTDSTSVFIKLIPSLDGSEVTAEFTNTAPTWDATKQGYYTTGTSERHVGRVYKNGVYWNLKGILRPGVLENVIDDRTFSVEMTVTTSSTYTNLPTGFKGEDVLILSNLTIYNIGSSQYSSVGWDERFIIYHSTMGSLANQIVLKNPNSAGTTIIYLTVI